MQNRKGAINHLTQLVGNTPLLNLDFFSPHPDRIHLFAKAEWLNPGYSVKDRAALNIIQTALGQGKLELGKRLLDASSGNTALSYAMLAAGFGIAVTLCVPENVGALQKSLLHAYGADVVYTSALDGSDGAIRLAKKLAAEDSDKYYYADQYNNPANWQAHYRGTAMEIWQQTHGRITHFVAGLGTTGTFVGVGRRLREIKPEIALYSIQPDSPFHGIEGLKFMETTIVPGIYDPGIADRNLLVSTEDAQTWVLRLAHKTGYLVGLSSGTAMAAATRLANEIDSGVIVTVFPDSAQRYMHENFWQEFNNAVSNKT
ncbi:MAG: PLP-dependent cysteine synthase family protein [bacterium]